eukprot:CAMPEP_0115885448 /NCGR_PEP_ID=MMETSP0287-20121206/30681_1 /TAXON_ID=412157 /ORGANISM="Chrysochromulina rotalis, Strain UIO044" /LENGTH=33 /DNA_ID= /DNA_START= /DNA_END= /DNA_ORIENTATION=
MTMAIGVACGLPGAFITEPARVADAAAVEADAT